MEVVEVVEVVDCNHITIATHSWISCDISGFSLCHSTIDYCGEPGVLRVRWAAAHMAWVRWV